MLLPLQNGPKTDKVLEVAQRICEIMKYDTAKSWGFWLKGLKEGGGG